MKKEFKKWLISLNCEGINSLGIDEMVSRVDEELRIVRANELERIVLEELISEFNKRVIKTALLAVLLFFLFAGFCFVLFSHFLACDFIFVFFPPIWVVIWIAF